MKTAPARRHRWIAAASVAAIACQAGQAAPPSAEQLFQQPFVSGAELSPSGRHVALRLAQKGGHHHLAVVELPSLRSIPVAALADSDIHMFHWVNDERLVFDQDTTLIRPGVVENAPGLFVVQRDGKGFRELVRTDADGFLKGQTYGRELQPWNTFWYGTDRAQKDVTVLVVRPEEHHLKGVDYVKLLRLNTTTGRDEEIDAPVHSFEWLMDSKGELRIAVTEQGNARVVHWRDASGRWAPLSESERFGGQSLAPLGIGPDDKLYVQAAPGRNTGAVYALDPTTKRLSNQPLVASDQFDLQPTFIISDSKLLGLRYAIDARVTTWFDDDMKAVQARVDQALPATVNEITPARRPETPFVLVESYSDVQPTTYYLFNPQSGKFTKLGSALSGLDPKDLGATDFVRYKARDGLEIPAWLTLPPGEKKKGLPLVVLVHGGPWARGHVWSFDPEVQFLASRGYAVLQPEFRGSTGFGERHFRAGWKQWGQAMQDDLADGVRWAVSQGVADSNRVCIGGASYGGYATLMGLIRDPDLYRCGFEWVGVTDLNLMYDVTWSDAGNVYKKYGMPRLIGDRDADAAMLKANSPLAQAERLNRPLLMAHGRYDVRVPMVHGEKLRDALKARGADPEWIVYDEGHGWRKPETHVDFWTRVEKFLDKHIGH